MPKLPAQARKAAESAETQNFEALDPGQYHVRLFEVDTTPSGPSGPYWRWTLEVLDDEHKGRRLWVNTSLAEKAAWKLKELYDAFGFTLDSDTDEMIGETCLATVTKRKIEQGSRAGEWGNNVDRLSPLADDGSEGSPDSEDVFS